MRIINAKGFTLIEVMIVMVLVGLTASLSFYGYQSLQQSATINEEVNKLANALKSARVWAFTRKQAVAISLFSGGKKMQALVNGTTTPIMENITLTESYAGPNIVITSRGTFANTAGGALVIYRSDSASTRSGKQDCISITNVHAILGDYDGSSCKTD